MAELYGIICGALFFVVFGLLSLADMVKGLDGEDTADR